MRFHPVSLGSLVALVALVLVVSTGCATLALDTALETGKIEAPCTPDSDGPAEVRALAGVRMVVPCGAAGRTWQEESKRLGIRVQFLDNLLVDGGRVYPRYSSVDSPYGLVIAWQDGAQRVLGVTTRQKGRQVETWDLDIATGSREPTDSSPIAGTLFERLAHPVLDREVQATLESAAMGRFVQATRTYEEHYRRASNIFWTPVLVAVRFLVNSGQPDPLLPYLDRLLEEVPGRDAASRAEVKALLLDANTRVGNYERWAAWEKAGHDAVEAKADAAKQAEKDREREEKQAIVRQERAEHDAAMANLLEAARVATKQKRYATAIALLTWREVESGKRGVDPRRVPTRTLEPAPELGEDELLEALQSKLFRATAARVEVKLKRPDGTLAHESTLLLPYAEGEALAYSTSFKVDATYDPGSINAVAETIQRRSERTETVTDTQAAALTKERLDALKSQASGLVARYQELEARLEAIERRLAEPASQVVMGAPETLGADRQSLRQECAPDPSGGGTIRCVNKWSNNVRYGPATRTPGRSIEETVALQEARPLLQEELARVRKELENVAADGTRLELARPETTTRAVTSTQAVGMQRLVGEGTLEFAVIRDGRPVKRGRQAAEMHSYLEEATADARRLMEVQLAYAVEDVAHREAADVLLAPYLKSIAGGTPEERAAERLFAEQFMKPDFLRDSIWPLRDLGHDIPCFRRHADHPAHCSW